MATAASGADAAILLVDAERGLLPQTRRHAAICSLFGIRHLILAVNKMDRIGFAQERFDEIVAAFGTFAERLAFASILPVPLSALRGDNVVERSGETSWWDGEPLLALLEEIEADDKAAERPLRMPVQLVLRQGERRRYAGTIASGRIETGATTFIAPAGRVVRVSDIEGPDGPVEQAEAGDAVTIALAENVDLARGDILSAHESAPLTSTGFAADLIWLADEASLLPGRSYLVRVGTATVPGTVTSLRHKLDIETLGELPATALVQNEIGRCNLSTTAPLAFDAFHDDPATGAFILIDRQDFRTVAAGVIRHDLRRATNVHPQALTIDKRARAAQKHQTPAILWFTGLSGAGKSTIANLVEERLWALGHHTMLLDGDNVRHGLNQDLGFSEADRVENIRRVGEVAKLLLESGLIVLCSFISPYRADRRMARELVEAEEFLEVFVDTPLSECIRRDPKGLYAKAISGTIPNFTGVSSAYEPPEQAEIHLDTLRGDADHLANDVVAELKRRGIIRQN
jgi:bifunctional enzyme CysN/CysC